MAGDAIKTMPSRAGILMVGLNSGVVDRAQSAMMAFLGRFHRD